ncbi:MAG: hypothetical protein LBO69_00515 [Ignavibacteria bacterium]|jgi:hypothetical protein|nr:hypothetical protein [Ignavibacteria bacterium]
MIQLSQYIHFKYIDAVLLLLCIGVLVVFINLLIKVFSAEDKKVHTAFYVIDVVFYVFLVLWSVLCFVPVSFNGILPADTEQVINIHNNTNEEQKVLLVGRLSYSNDWVPVIPYSPEFQGTPITTLIGGEKAKLRLRVGVNDIDNIIIANVTKSSYSGKVGGIVLPLPQNEIVVYTEPMNELARKPEVSILHQLLNICMYITGIVGFVWLFFLRFKSMEEKSVLSIVFIAIAVAIPATACGFAFWWNLQDLLSLL